MTQTRKKLRSTLPPENLHCESSARHPSIRTSRFARIGRIRSSARNPGGSNPLFAPIHTKVLIYRDRWNRRTSLNATGRCRRPSVTTSIPTYRIHQAVPSIISLSPYYQSPYSGARMQSVNRLTWQRKSWSRLGHRKLPS